MMGRIALAAALATLVALATGPGARAQFKIESPTDLAVRAAAVAPTPAQQAAQNAANRYIPPTAEEMRKRGLAEAPALAAEAGLDCHVADARWLGDSHPERAHRPLSVYYEIACSGDLGYVLMKTKGAPTQAITCLESSVSRPDGKRNDLRCALPENQDPRIGLIPYVAHTGKACTPDRVRALGHSDRNTAFELACREGAGFIMLTSSPPRQDKVIEIHPCLAYSTGDKVSCAFTDPQAQAAMVDRLAARAAGDCAVKARAYIGESDRDGASFWEVACAGGRGYLLKQGLDGGLARSADCASADLILTGGCRLTDTRQARLEQASAYADRVRAAGLDCQVSSYAQRAPRADGAQVVELACVNRPAGAIAFFPQSGAASLVDCAHAQLIGYRCGLSPASAAYPALTADLHALGKTTCVVSDARPVGLSADRHAYAEVACADGLQGFMIEYALDPITPVAATVCAEAKAVGSGCALPPNRPS
jgi:hypothetical protein